MNNNSHQFKVIAETGNGWKQLSFTFTAVSTPRWWQFWMREVKPQEFTASMWVKPEDKLILHSPILETRGGTYE